MESLAEAVIISNESALGKCRNRERGRSCWISSKMAKSQETWWASSSLQPRNFWLEGCQHALGRRPKQRRRHVRSFESWRFGRLGFPQGRLIEHVRGPDGFTSDLTAGITSQAPKIVQSCQGAGLNVETYRKHAEVEKPLEALARMDLEGSVPSVQVYKNLLQACIKNKDVAQAKGVHSHLVKNGLQSNLYLGECMVDALVKCGSLVDGLHMFQMLPSRSVFSWTAIICGYSKAGQWQEALTIYQQMREEAVDPNLYIFVNLLKACSSLADLQKGKDIHVDIVKHGFEADMFVGTALVDMYAKCGSISDAQHVFDGLAQLDTVSWNAMIAGHAQRQQGDKAWQLYSQMLKDGFTPNDRTFVSVLQACGCLAELEESALEDGILVKVESLRKGKAVHTEVHRRGYHGDTFICNALVTMYAKCGGLSNARQVFDNLSRRDIVSWNAMLSGYSQQEQGERALDLYVEMQKMGVSPNRRTFLSVLQACCSLAEKEFENRRDVHFKRVRLLHIGKVIHAEAVQRGYDTDTFLSTGLVTLYGKCGSIIHAEKLFGRVPQRNVVPWNAMLAAYAQQGQVGKVLDLFKQMQAEGIRPNQRTFASMVQACGCLAEKEQDALVDRQRMKVASLQKGKCMHARAASHGYARDTFFTNALLSMYAKCGSIMDADHVFHSSRQRDVVSWNTLLTAHAQRGQGEKALQLYAQMQAESVTPNHVTLLSVLEACSNTGALNNCVQLHRDVLKHGLESHPIVATALIDAYSKCGSMEEAHNFFDSLLHKDLWSWSALITGYAQQGEYERCKETYREMCRTGIVPDSITFLSVLAACSHAGKVDEGLHYFESMTNEHGIAPTTEHYGCLLNLLARAGLFSKVEHLLAEMPVEPTLPMWLSLLSACQKHGNVELARRAFNRASQTQPEHCSAYLLMFNIYSEAGMWESAQEIDQLRRRAGAWKSPGQSWIEHEQEVHTFVVGDSRHPQHQDLLAYLEILKLEITIRTSTMGVEESMDLGFQRKPSLSMKGDPALTRFHIDKGLMSG